MKEEIRLPFSWAPEAWIVTLGALFFLPWLGGVHLFDWDEINFAECAREMLVTGDYLRVSMHYLPFWEKPPLFFWMQAAAMKALGVGEYASRLPNALCGIVTLLVLYRSGRRVAGQSFGLLWAACYFGAVLPHFYFRSGIIDPWFNLFMFLALREWLELTRTEAQKASKLALSGVYLGLAVLTKGPVGILVPALTAFVWWAWGRFRYAWPWAQLPLVLVTALATVALWLGTEIARNGTWFTETFLTYQWRLFTTEDAGHGGFFGYHFVVLLVGCFPVSIFALRALGRGFVTGNPALNGYRTWMVVLFWVVLLLFTYVKTKIVHYSSMAYFPISFLGALTLHEMLLGRLALARWMKVTLWVLGSIIALLPTVLPYLAQHPDLLRPLMAKDPFAAANLDAYDEINWWGVEWLCGPWMLLLLWQGLANLKHERFRLGFAWLLGGTAIWVFAVLVCFIGRIEAFSQRANVAFFQSLQGKDVYLFTQGFKSYVPPFYARMRPEQRPHSEDLDAWRKYLLYGQPDKDVYISAKVTAVKDLADVPNLEKLGEKNGFVFYRRRAQTPPGQ